MATIVMPRDKSGEQMMQQAILSAVQGFQESQREKARMKQQSEQFGQTFGLEQERVAAEKAEREAATKLRGAETDKVRDDMLNTRADKYADGVISVATENFFKRGEHEKGGQFVVGSLQNLEKTVQSNPNDPDLAKFRQRVAERLVAYFTEQPDTDAARATREGAKFTADAAARAAAGGESAQDINIATKTGTGDFQPAYSFGDLVQREAGDKDYGQYVDIAGGRTPSAADRLQADTNVRTTGMQTGSAERIAAMNRESAERVAAQKAKGSAGLTASHQARFDRIRESANDLINRASPWNTGFGSWLSGVPTSDARDYRADLEQLVADISFGALQDMRDNSKTGGALGSIAVRELELLGSTLGNVADTGQSKENLLKNLRNAVASVDRWEAALKAQSGGASSKTVTRAELRQLGATEDEARADGYTVID